jgi:hypothetical protein
MSETGLRFSSRINSNKIVHQHVKSNKRKCAFTLRVSRRWNKLPDTVVNALTLNTFKNRLDRYWKNQDLYFNNYKSDIQWQGRIQGRGGGAPGARPPKIGKNMIFFGVKS